MSIDVVQIIDSYTEQIQPRMIQQYKDAPNFNFVVSGECSQTDTEEIAFLSIKATRILSEAQGLQLDNIGALFVEIRKGRIDADYRQAIYEKISVRTFATASSICEVIKIIFGATYARLYPEYPAGFSLVTDADITTAQVEALSGAGIQAKSAGYLKTIAGEFLTTSLGERLIVTV